MELYGPAIFMSTDGLHLTRGLSIESDGVVRLGTSGSGLFAETAVLLPRPTGAAPGYLWSTGDPVPDPGGAGAIVSLGGAGTTTDGTRYVGALFVGAVPGSYLEVDAKKGDMSLYGIPLPDRMTLPTTLVGGLTFRRHGKDFRFDATLGGFVNPAGLMPTDLTKGLLKEDVAGGGFGGLSYRTGDFSVSGDVLVDVNRTGGVSLGGARLTFGFRF